MSKDFKTIERDEVTNLSALRKEVPDTMRAFASLAAASTETHALDTKTKETIALAIYKGGGPSAVYGGDALAAYNQFSAE